MKNLLAVLIVALCGCSGSLFKSKVEPASVYLLSAQGAARAGGALPADVAVLKPLVRAGLDTDRVAALYPDRRLDFYAGARWSGPLDEVIQDLAVQAFHAHADLRNVSADASAFANAYWVEIEVDAFQAEYTAGTTAPTIHVHLRARVGRAADRRVLGQFDADARQAAADNRLTAIIEAYQRAANGALAEVVGNTVRTLGASLEAR
jgi:ABC-type uncharacterized transport system auxiliary subunit